MAAESVDLAVSGTIAPASCTPLLASNGEINYGQIKGDALDQNNYNLLESRQLAFTLTCSAPAAVALRAISARIGSTVTEGSEGSRGFAPAPIALFGQAAGTIPAAGLGYYDTNKKIGGLAARLISADTQADSKQVSQLVSNNNGASWTAATAGAPLLLNDGLTSWGTAGSQTPVPFTQLTGNMEVQPYLDKASNLSLTRAIELDGLVTFEVVYL